MLSFKKLLKIFLSIALLISVNFIYEAEAASTVKLDSVVAVVNDQVVTESQLQKQLSAIRQQLQQQQVKLPTEKALRQQVLNHLIDVELQLHYAKQAGIEVNPTEVNAAIADIATRNHLSMTDLKAQLVQNGLTYKEYQDNIRKEIILGRFQQVAVGQEVKFTRQQFGEFVKQYKNYRQNNAGDTVYRIKDILIPLPENPTPAQISEAQTQANTVINNLKKGADFSQMAVMHSSGTNALQGGDLGWRHLTELPEVFTKVVVALPVGGVSSAVKAPNGFHIIQLVDRKSQNGSGPMTEADLKKLFYQRKFETAMQGWLQKARSRAYIKILKDN